MAVSPAPRNALRDWHVCKSVTFDILSDYSNTVGRAYKVVYTDTAEMERWHKKAGLDIARLNGTDRAELPLPATYIIDTNHVVHKVYIDPEYFRRAEPADIVSELKKMQTGRQNDTAGR